MDRSDVQGFVLHGYGSRPFARFHFLSFADGSARRLVSRLAYDVCVASEPEVRVRHQLGFTARGLQQLGLPEAALAQFPLELRQGLAHPERCVALGAASDAARSWLVGGSRAAPLDAVWLSFASSAAERAERAAEHERLFERFGVAWSSHDAERVPNQKPSQVRRRRRKGQLALGEVLLGARDGAGERAIGPLVPAKFGFRELPAFRPREAALDLGGSGSFLALLRLADTDGARAGELAALLDTRLSCRAYARGDGRGESWLAALNVDFRRQLELGLQELTNPAHGAGHGSESPLRLCGGGYFFLPSRRALNYLVEA